MENSSIHTTRVEGGTYNITSPLHLTSADDGMSFIAAPGQRPVLDGRAAGLSTLITLNGADDVTLRGLTFESTARAHAHHAVTLTDSTGDHIVGNHYFVAPSEFKNAVDGLSFHDGHHAST
jgi:hypothetical protein